MGNSSAGKQNIYILLLTALFAFLLTGCAKEDRLARQQEAMDAGLYALENGQYDQAIASFDAALGESIGRIGVKEIDINYYKAAAQNLAGDYEGAIATYTAVIDYLKEDPNPYFLRGSIYLLSGNIPNAVTDYRTSVSLCDKDYELYIQIYNNLIHYADEASAQEFLNLALMLNDKSAISYLQRGRIYFMMGQNELAESELVTAQKKGKTEAAIYLAQVYETEGRYEEAESVLDAYLSSGTPTCTAFNTMGLLSLQKGDYENALFYFNQGLELELVTNEQSLLRNRIIAMEYLGMYQEARTAMSEYLTLYPKDEEAIREAVFLETRGASEAEQNPPPPEPEESGEEDTGDGSDDTQTTDAPAA